jgi:predicted DNA-binding helix-hairpin-helix protein
MLPLDIDPKTAWALKHRAAFPVDINKAPREVMLRVPGLGVRSVNALVRARRYRTLRLEDVARLTRGLDRLRPFIVAADWRPLALAESAVMRPRLVKAERSQLELFG